MKNYRITIKDMNPAYKNWSKKEIIMDNLGKSIVIDGVNEFGTPFSDDDRLCDLFDDGRVSTEFGGLFPLNQISLVNVAYKNEDFIYGVSFNEEFPPEVRDRLKIKQDFINYAYYNGIMINIYDGSYHEISDVNNCGFFINFEDSLNDKSYFKFNEIKLLGIDKSNTNEYKFDQFYDDIKVLKNAVSSLQRKVAFQEEIISKLLNFVDDSMFLVSPKAKQEADIQYFNGNAKVYLKEIKDKTYRTVDER